MNQRKKELAMYLLFGCLTTAINFACYYVSYSILNMSNIISVTAAWIISVVFAFVTNKLYVFNSYRFEKNVVLKELALFFVCRIFSGIIDVLIMYLTVDRFNLNYAACKLASNVLVIIINYILSKFHVFEN